MSFQIHALPAEPFRKFFSYDDAQLHSIGARLEIVASKPGYPCRVSLADADIGDTVLLINYEHQPELSPYRAAHAIYVRKGVEEARVRVEEIPHVLSSRLMSIRGFDNEHLMREADVVDGENLRKAIEQMFSNDQISYIHLHNAKPGCFAARVSRA